MPECRVVNGKTYCWEPSEQRWYHVTAVPEAVQNEYPQNGGHYVGSETVEREEVEDVNFIYPGETGLPQGGKLPEGSEGVYTGGGALMDLTGGFGNIPYEYTGGAGSGELEEVSSPNLVPVKRQGGRAKKRRERLPFFIGDDFDQMAYLAANFSGKELENHVMALVTARM